ncbi:MAG TPA: hypothetical protein PLH94_06210 [Fimbriimonadaceae bacterium]|nr:hypothetical protein [Fimbriimonadaceae bacterium]
MRSEKASNGKPASRKAFPWLPLLILIASLYVFWILPMQLGDRPVRVEFDRKKP